MLKPNTGLSSLSSLLTDEQSVRWSHQRMLAIASQLAMLVISVVLVINVIITLGERRLQQEWATQRYSELQSVGTMIADKVTFQQFRTQTFARGELLRQYLETGDEALKEKLLLQWTGLQKNMPELMGIALFNANGEFLFASTDVFGRQTLPPSLLGGARNMGGNEIYSSPMEFLSVNGDLEPYMYQLAWLENPDQSVRGYLVTYNSMLRTLDMVKPALSANQQPMMMFDTQGLMYAGASDAPLPRLPEGLSGSLRQSYPALWRQMAMSNFGQFHGDDATFVYLKVDLTTQYETRREYFLVSYIRNDDIASRFSQWQTILVIGAFILTLLAAAVVILTHLFRLEQRARHNSIQLAADLFTGEEGQLLVNDKGRVLSANPKAGSLLNLAANQLTDRSLQRCLQLDDESFEKIIATAKAKGEWRGEVSLDELPGAVIRVVLRYTRANTERQRYFLVSLSDISELAQSRREESMHRLLADSAVATALTRADGTLLKFNNAFEQLLEYNEPLGANLADILENDLGNQWPRITQMVAMQGSWQGQILCSNNASTCLQATLKGHLDDEGDIEYLVCTLEQASSRNRNRENSQLIPNRSTILANLEDLERYYDALGEQSRNQSCLMLMDISPAGMLSHMSDIGQLEKRQQEVETLLLKELPSNSQISHWQLGKLVVILPGTDSNAVHKYAVDVLDALNSMGLGEGISIGIAAHQQGQNLEAFISHAEIALKRAKQTGDQKICQAFTR
ncbi:PAS domain-containing protein [Shewanella litorisediminis]|uniref:PAS domain-containing protein n=1 Tax=Shewanella litorisediminis TaxID=1173586 RepID=A0ABX7G156_9GAMM|nr:PAS domain-containing protein [Shewanella litorisediminis]MCL2918939.1 PAS domain-containing protein [Shewanella litorisediminis]QRH01008.1 PAS domain-containing protein [Shewanella litorisediminis]